MRLHKLVVTQDSGTLPMGDLSLYCYIIIKCSSLDHKSALGVPKTMASCIYSDKFSTLICYKVMKKIFFTIINSAVSIPGMFVMYTTTNFPSSACTTTTTSLAYSVEIQRVRVSRCAEDIGSKFDARIQFFFAKRA